MMSARNVLLSTLLVWAPSAFAVNVGDKMPAVGVSDSAGAQKQPWAGQKTLVNFWATWCDACKVELREMEKELARVPGGAKVIFVSLDKDVSKAKDYMSKEFKASPAMTENLYFDGAFILADALNVDSFPMTLIVDQNGKVEKIQSGFKEGTGSTAALFDALRQK